MVELYKSTRVVLGNESLTSFLRNSKSPFRLSHRSESAGRSFGLLLSAHHYPLSTMQFSLCTAFALFGLVVASPIPSGLPNKELAERQTPLTTFLDVLLDNLPVIDGTIVAVAGILTLFENALAELTGEQTTYNDLSGACKPYTVVFARGTTEPGNVGILVGPPLFEALREKLGSSNLAIQGVNNYKADIEGYLEGGDPGGITSM